MSGFKYMLLSLWPLLFGCQVVSYSLRPNELQHARLPCPLLSPLVCSNLCPLSHWCHPIILSSVTPLSSCSQSFPTSGSFPMNWLFASGGQSIGALASHLSMNIQGWFLLGLNGLISLQSQVLSRVFCSTTIQKHRFFGTQPSLWSSSHTHTWLLEKPWLWISGPHQQSDVSAFNTLSGFVIAFLPRRYLHVV